MADRRKLQGEIERCLKKVQEGVEAFEDTWQKVHNATNTNQKEKYEADLKKEIKKLQRLRDQIKTWVASNDIKDKRVLMDTRRLIETQMERFKVVERETKTKAYSKEGLGAATKQDPKEKEKEEMNVWLQACLDRLNLEIDQFESELESLTSRKKKIDRDKQDRIDELRGHLEKHRFHIRQLETIMRLLDNEALEIDQIQTIRDDVDYYVESSQEPDFEENEFLYDDLDLDNAELTVNNQMLATSPTDDDNDLTTTPTSNHSSSPSPSPSLSNSANHSSSGSVQRRASDDSERRRHKSQSEEVTRTNNVTKTPTKGVAPGGVISSSTASPHLERIAMPPAHSHSNGPSSAGGWGEPTPGSGGGLSPVTPGLASGGSLPPVVTPTSSTHPFSVSPGPAAAATGLGMHTAAGSTTQPPVNGTAGQPPHNSTAVNLTPLLTSFPVQNSQSVGSHPNLTTPVTQQLCDQPTPVLNGPGSVQTLQHQQQQQQQQQKQQQQQQSLLLKPNSSESMSSLKTMAQHAVEEANSMHTPVDRSIFDGVGPVMPKPPPAPSPADGTTGSLPSSQATANNTTTIHLNPLLGVAPLGPQPLSKEQCYQLAMLDAAFQHLPQPADSERVRQYLPRSPCPTPAHYPPAPPPGSDTVDFFLRLSVETLFFIFYYMEGTKAQYLAARALKKQSWRFHTKYRMWFQRHEEPKTITEEYEQGTYIYFDYEKWGQRKKDGFTFEYCYLEDRELN